MRKVERHRCTDGTYTYRVRFRRDGKQSSESFTVERAAAEFASMLDAIGATRALAWLDAQLERDTPAPTLDEWAPRHIDALTGITAGTRGEYRRMYGRRWSRALGASPLTSIDREAVARAVNTEFATASDKTVRNYHGLLSAILASAVEAGHIPTNPCKGMRLPRRTEHTDDDMRLLGQAEFDRLVRQFAEHWQPLIYFLAGTGCRWGEAAALNVRDLHLDEATVLVRSGVKWARGGDAGGVGPTKTRRSRRSVTLPAQLVQRLGPVVAGKGAGDLVFTAPRGGPIRQGNFWTRQWEPATVAAALDPRPRIHDLRHSHASWLIAAGVPLPVIQRRLGHESITTTIDRYGHLAPDIQVAAAAAADAVFGTVGQIEG